MNKEKALRCFEVTKLVASWIVKVAGIWVEEKRKYSKHIPKFPPTNKVSPIKTRLTIQTRKMSFITLNKRITKFWPIGSELEVLTERSEFVDF
jgi:hypothetical protein